MRIQAAIVAICLAPGVVDAQFLPTNPGDPLPGLSAADVQLFHSGRAEFLRIQPTAAAPAVPPVLDRATTQTCSGCHQYEAVGSADGLFTPQSGVRTSLALFGAGLIEGIPDETILAMEQRPEALVLGIRGRAARVIDPATGQVRVGRFGWKAQYANLPDMAADRLVRFLGVPAAESRGEVNERLAVFARFLAPVGRLPGNATTLKGEHAFQRSGCSGCHRAETNTIFIHLKPIANSMPIHPYSDFLLHDIGTGDGVAEGAAMPNEIRTAPLWGLRLRQFLMHDGSAKTLEEAIARHKGDATLVRQRYDALPADEKQALIAFLKTL